MFKLKLVACQLFLLLILLTSCSTNYKVVTDYETTKLPKAEIVFEHSGYLIFLNSSGEKQGKVRIQVDCKSKLFCNDNNDLILKGVTWSRDSHSIIGSLWEMGPEQLRPIMIFTDGTILVCPNEKRLYPPVHNRLLRDKTLLAIEMSRDKKLSLVEYNMETCEIERYVYGFVKQGPIGDIDISKNGWLAVLGLNSIDIYDQTGNQKYSIQNSYCPAWSPQGDKLMVTKDKDIQVYGIDGNLSLQLPKTNRCPVWSPDGRQILYSDLNGVKIINIGSMEITEIQIGEEILPSDIEGNFDWNWNLQ